MADGNGLNLLGSPELSDFRKRNADILAGPTPEEVRRSASSAGAGLDLAGASPASSGLDLGKAAETILGLPGRLIGDVLAPLATGRTGPELRRQIEQDRRANLEAVRAQTRAANIESFINGYKALAPIAASISAAPADQQEALIAQAAPIFSQATGSEENGQAWLRSLVENASVSRMSAEEYFDVKNDPLGAALLNSVNSDPTKLKPEQIYKFNEHKRDLNVDKNLGPIKKAVNEVNRIYEMRHPQEAQKEKKSERGLSQSEFAARVSDPEVIAQIPFLQTPQGQSLLRDAYNAMPERIGLISDAEAGTIRLEYGKRAAEAAFKAPQQPKNAVNMMTPDGNIYLSYDGGRTIQTDSGPQPPPVGTRIFGTQVSGGPEDFGPTAKDVSSLRQVEIGTRQFLDLSRRTRALFKDRPEVLGAPGAFANLAESLGSTAEGFAKLVNLTFTVDGNTVNPRQYQIESAEKFASDIDRVVHGLEKTGIDRARIRSSVVALAFAAAAASGQTGHGVSDRDFKAFLDRVGESASPQIFDAVLRDVENDMIQNFNITYDVMTRGMEDPPRRPILIPSTGGDSETGKTTKPTVSETPKKLIVREIP